MIRLTRVLLSFLFISLNIIGKIRLDDLSLDEKIGQLFIVATNANNYHDDTYNLDPHITQQLIEQYHVGGIIFLGHGTPDAQRNLSEHLQKISKYPLLIAQDCEWGLSMRLTQNVLTYPKAMTLGALDTSHHHLIYELGKEIAAQCRMLGVNINFAPVVDVNNNPHNPIINTRSFGDNPQRVAQCASLYMQGMLDGNIIPCAKHFPGHGDTHSDSHHTLPLIPFALERLLTLELFPFKTLIAENIPLIMIGHLAVPAITNSFTSPSSLNPKTISFLRNMMGFDGIIMTDGLGMKAISNHYQPGYGEFEALRAGCDLLLCPLDVPQAAALIKEAIKTGIISVTEIDEHVKKIIAIKNSINNPMPLYDASRFICPAALQLQQALYDTAMTYVRGTITITKKNNPLLLLTITNQSHEPFVPEIAAHYITRHLSLPLNATEQECAAINDILEHHDQIIISIHVTSRSGMIAHNNYPIINLINKLGPKAIVVMFGNPYNIGLFEECPNILLAYENEPAAQNSAARVISGQLIPTGILPITLSIAHL